MYYKHYSNWMNLYPNCCDEVHPAQGSRPFRLVGLNPDPKLSWARYCKWCKVALICSTQAYSEAWRIRVRVFVYARMVIVWIDKSTVWPRSRKMNPGRDCSRGIAYHVWRVCRPTMEELTGCKNFFLNRARARYARDNCLNENGCIPGVCVSNY